MAETKPPFRADHVGSLLRPQKLIAAHEAAAAGKLPPAELRSIEDEAIRAAVAMQERVGLRAVTDGEMRRNNWRDRFFERVDGWSRERIPSSFIFTEYSGEERRGMPIPTVVEKLRRRESLTADDFAFLKPLTKYTAKATLPSPSANHFFAGDRGFAGSPYRDRREFFADVNAIYRQEIADLAAKGCTYLQIDEVPVAVLCDPRNQAIVRARGEDPDALVEDYIAAINDAVRGRPPSMTVCVHLCRGNAGHGQASGGYDPVARRLFGALDVRWLLPRIRYRARRRVRAARKRAQGQEGRARHRQHQIARARGRRWGEAPDRRGGAISRSRPALSFAAMRLRLELPDRPHDGGRRGTQARASRTYRT